MAAGPPNLSDAIDLLLKNEPTVFRTATETLFKVVKNIEAHPAEPRYRELSVSSASFTGKIAPVKGGVRFLRALGFEKTTVKGSPSADARADGHEAMVLAAPDAATLSRGKMALKVQKPHTRRIPSPGTRTLPRTHFRWPMSSAYQASRRASTPKKGSPDRPSD
jgi:hypothetical protein